MLPAPLFPAWRQPVLLLGLVYLSAVGAVYFRPDHGVVATWWPAAGFTVALLVLDRRERWGTYAGLLVVVTALANVSGGRDWSVSVLFGLANATEAIVVAAVLCRRSDDPPKLSTPEDFFEVIVASLLGALTLGLAVALTVSVTGGDAWVAVRTAAPSHLAATVVIVPLLLLRARPAGAPRLARRRPLELVAQSSLLLATLIVVFAPEQALALAFLPLPLLIWAALRLGPFVVAVELFVIGVLTTWFTSRGGGPFAIGARSERIDELLAGTQVQVFLVAAAVMGITSALAAAQRSSLLRGLTTERELATSMLEATAAIIMVVDRDGRVLRVNPATSRVTGFASVDLIGEPIWECGLIPPERVDLVRQMFESVDGTSVPGSREADILTVTGGRRRVVWNNSVLCDELGNVVHLVFTGTDVTRERTTSGMLHHLLEAPMATVLVGLDSRGRVTVFNRGAEEMLGLSTAEVLGRPIEDVVVSGQPHAYLRGDPGRTAGADPRVVATDLVDLAVTSDWTWRASSGRELTVSTTISVVSDVVGETVGYLCVGRDVTEQRQTQEMLVAALEKERHGMDRLRRLDAAKNEFVSTVSHELRTPTTSIVGYVEMLRDGSAGDPTPEQVPMLEAIARNGERLIAVAGDLLTLAGLESESGVEWERAPVDLAAIVAHGEEAVRSLLANRALEVEFSVTDPVTVIGDAGHLDRVLMNLLSNAIKFTPDGGRVACRLERCGRYAALEVSDTGIGIPAEEQGELFTKFFRSSTAQEKAIQGTGLGLSIISSIVAAHGGDIEVRSASGEGSSFTVTLPLARQSARHPAPQAGQSTAGQPVRNG